MQGEYKLTHSRRKNSHVQGDGGGQDQNRDLPVRTVCLTQWGKMPFLENNEKLGGGLVVWNLW